MQTEFADISKRLQENALSDYAKLYRDSNGDVNYMVVGSYEYSVCGSLVTVLQKTVLTDEEKDEEYEALCFDVNTGEMYNIGSLFKADFNWRTDLKDLLVSAYKKQSVEFSSAINEDVVAALSQKLDRNIGFLLEQDGVKLYIACGSGSKTIFLSYDELKPYIDEQSEIWQHMTAATEQ